LCLAYLAVQLRTGKWTQKRTQKRPWGNGPLDGSGRTLLPKFAEILLNVRGGEIIPSSREPVCKKKIVSAKI
jgi:hypothetical protein